MDVMYLCSKGRIRRQHDVEFGQVQRVKRCPVGKLNTLVNQDFEGAMACVLVELLLPLPDNRLRRYNESSAAWDALTFGQTMQTLPAAS